MPDIENMVSLAHIFKVTLDELVSNEIINEKSPSKNYVSETVYDIDCVKNIDIKLISARGIDIGYNVNEKLHIKLESKTIEDLTSLFKVKIDDNGKRIDVDCIKKKEISKTKMSQDLYITILLPCNYTKHCEIEADSEELNLKGLQLESIEYDGDAKHVNISKCSGSLEFAGKSDYNMTIDRIRGKLEITQIKATTVLNISEDSDFKVEIKKKNVSVYWKNNGEECESYENMDSENVISLNGMKSEVIINRKI